MSDSTFSSTAMPMPRFVILHHQFPAGHDRATHWDWMLESGEILRTWAVSDPPDTGGLMACEATPLPDHRLHYLDYQGPVSNDRGSVTQWDAGSYELLAEAGDSLRIRLHGQKMHGLLLLEATPRKRECTTIGSAALRSGETETQRWRLSFSAEPTTG